MQQYREIKARHRDAILFFRMGDFYEMFFEDAELAARELGLTLTTRNNGGAADVPLAGVPVRAAGEYLRRLVERGYRVAICEQIEDPKQAKGVVRRAVVETVTPGAALEEGLLDATRNNFLLAVLPGEEIGLAAVDLSTGEFFLEVTAPEHFRAALLRFDPKEVVLPSGSRLDLPEGILITERESWEFDCSWASEELARRFGVLGLEGLGIEPRDRPAIGASGALLRYAAELKPSGLPQLSRPVVLRGGALMPLDEMTRRNLELVEPMRPGAGGTTLLKILDQTVTPMGGRLLRQWLVAPLCAPDRIRERHDAVEVLVEDSRARDRLREALKGVRDLERLASRAANRRATPRDLGALRDSLCRLPDVAEALQGMKRREASSELERIASELDSLADLAAALREALVPDPPPQLGEGDTIRPGADPELDEARDLRDGGKRFIAALQARERERTGIQSLKVGYNKVFGYYLEVTKAQRHAVPPDYERRQTLANAERYVTPELKEYEARVLGAEERIAERERELFDGLCGRIADSIGRIQRTARLLAQLDAFASLAEVAVRNRYTRPEITGDFSIELAGCRHPVVEQCLPAGSFIPNDILLDRSQRVILLTGPNMAGKSTILRQVGLAVIMAQMGSFVPADRARIGVVDRVFTRVGASDNLGMGQSTFMVEMIETSAILHGATERSLVLLDEIGRGTSTYDGVAIAWAVTEQLHDRIGCKTIFATHYHELTQLTERLQHARNFNVAVRETADGIVFLHRLRPGATDRSYGIHVARLAGLPLEVVRRAREILAGLEAGHRVTPVHPPPEGSDQLALFETEHSVIRDLLELDPDRLTPIEALTRLAELKKRAAPGGSR
jgi:DNA mismatch repair protein MutS